MRGIEFLIIVGIVGVLTLAVWQGRHWFTVPGSSPVAVQHPASTATVPETQKAHDRKSKSTANRSRGKQLLADSTLPPEEVRAAMSTIIVPVPVAPRPEDLAPGTTSAQIRQAYGAPTLQFSYNENGSLVERMYYLGPRGGDLTVATLRNGKLVFAQTLQR